MSGFGFVEEIDGKQYVSIPNGLDALEGMLMNMLSLTCTSKEYKIMALNINGVFRRFKEENKIN